MKVLINKIAHQFSIGLNLLTCCHFKGFSGKKLAWSEFDRSLLNQRFVYCRADLLVKGHYIPCV